ncbi:HTH domain-containing protein [Persephonella sp.]
MTIKEAIFKALERTKKPVNVKEIYKIIQENNLYKFGAKDPVAVISQELRRIRSKGDKRLGVIKDNGRSFLYYYKDKNIGIDIEEKNSTEKGFSFKERSLHKLFSTYLRKVEDVYSKTIFHEKSSKKDKNQKWLHPDMVGVKFIKLETETIKNLLLTTKRDRSFLLYSYELKREIITDSQLKEAYFQAVSNSSWSNYGYLVAFHINDNLISELERLNQSFGIGFILLKSNPFESEIIFRAKYKDLDLQTMDKLCSSNSDFKEFIEKLEKYISADIRYKNEIFKNLEEFCDSILITDSEIKRYCKDNNIPYEDDSDGSVYKSV